MIGLNTTTRWAALVLAAAALAGCAQEAGPAAAEDFVSDNPYGGENGGSGTGDPTDGGDDGGGDSGGDDGSRDVAEADIVHIEGDRLYALSRYGGLTIVDVSTPDELPVLGRFRAHAEPFEMYVEQGQVFVMYQGWGEYAEDPESGEYTWQADSRLLALDASNPASISVEGDFSMPGYLSDSRRVGDVLYIVSKEDSWCWSCAEGTNDTVVTSLDVSDETDVQMVDQLRLEDEHSWGGLRSVSANDQRLYIGGPDWNAGPDDFSTIEVIDISDPSGSLSAGASIAVAGRIESRWQMDEHEGVLRVISQPGWSSTTPPRVETFEVTTATDITPVGNLAMTLPRPETLQSVRFDGERAYAITFEQTDPLFTLDLSDPAVPVQVGELEIPGFVYHMETRGDRVLGIGFDRDNPNGSLNASLFDVSDFANPTMLERVNFGGDWASFAEDQDRLHKSFQVLDEHGLLLVPFSGWSDNGDGDSCGEYLSGIQLVDWADDTLALRGVAPMSGNARRSLLHDERLLAVSDSSVEVFDVSDRDTPERTTQLTTANIADHLAMSDDGAVMVRMATDWWSGETRLETVDPATPQSPLALGSLSLDPLTPPPPAGPEGAEWGCAHYGYLQSEMFVHDGFVYLVREDSLGGGWGPDANTVIDVVDVTDPSAPTYLESLEIPGTRSRSAGQSVSSDEEAVRIVGDTMVIVTGFQDWQEDGPGSSASSFELVDLSVPGAPTHAQSIARPEALAHGGLQLHDGVGVSWHMAAVSADTSKVRFFLERLDLTSAAEASTAPPVNVPGTVIAWDNAASRAVVVDFQLESTSDQETCWSHAASWYSYEDDACALVQRPLHLLQVHADGATLLDTVDIQGTDGGIRQATASDERLFVSLQHGSYAWTEDGGYIGSPQSQVAIVADWSADSLAVAGTQVVGHGGGWLGELTALGTQLLFQASSGLGQLDASNPAAPSLTLHELWGSYCADLHTRDGIAYCAAGAWGVQALPLD
ncbi:MAG: beta-propeller domain-containing protein [Nannocystales bacterium]